MKLSEQLGPSERPEQRQEIDPRQQAEDMVANHNRKLVELEQSISEPSVLQEAMMSATEDFKEQLEAYLLKNLPEAEATALYEELTKPLDLSEFISSSEQA